MLASASKDATNARYMVQIRHTMKLDAPIAYSVKNSAFQLTVSVAHLRMLVALANKKFHENVALMQRLLGGFKEDLAAQHQPAREAKEELKRQKKEAGLLRQREHSAKVKDHEQDLDCLPSLFGAL
jgi:tRNA(Phe) wybutosine-synthesizing methylase Tyw3